jgi:ribonuclease HIII
VKVCKFAMIICNIAVKIYKFAGFFLLKLLGSVDEVGVGFFFGCLCLISVE